MSLLYRQTEGTLHGVAQDIFSGYSGAGEGKNNSAMQQVHNIGPIPQGKYEIVGEPFSSSEHGPFVLRLEPDPDNEMYGRAGFLIHGDNVHEPGTASEGCIILPRFAREAIWNSGLRQLEVVA